ncbi:hypothetical protein LPJ53_003416 [Coemansia erecta]|uniref:ABC1 atypical kinase-like domain-containing protein n=1 Tax=Coemansia erecta TaxID=147472 RepID=A0A9W7XZA0_9FUNG|nr:hypothetical protein LPJ53_003416 [Coemansia erecta]
MFRRSAQLLTRRMLRPLPQHTRRRRAFLGIGLAAGGGGTAFIAYSTLHRQRSTKPAPDSLPPPLPALLPQPTDTAPKPRTLLGRLLAGTRVALRLLTLLAYFAPLILAYYPLHWTGHASAWYALLRRQLSRAGPAFVKLAQWAGTRRDIFPQALCAELSRLHDHNAPHPSAYSRAMVAHALGRPLGSEDQWHDVPEGVGAVAQVHRMCLGDREVAVKVLHPGVAQMIARDLLIIEAAAQVLHVLVPGARWLSLPDEAAHFAQMMRAQTDLRVEAQNLIRFADNFARGGRAGVRFPRPFEGSAAEGAEAVLVESFCDALPLQAFMLETGHTAFDRALGALGLDAFLHMLIADNFVHADLHPGNILVELNPPPSESPLDRFVEDFYDMSPFTHRVLGSQGAQQQQLPQQPPPSRQEAHTHVRQILRDHAQGRITRTERDQQVRRYCEQLYLQGFTPSLVLIDCGLATQLDRASRRNFIDLFSAVCTFDGRRAGHLMVERCREPSRVLDADVFVLRIQDVILRVRDTSLRLSRMSFAEVFGPVLAAVRAHHVRLAPEFVNVVLAMFVLEGVGRALDPDTDVLSAALPLLRRWVAEEAPLGEAKAVGWQSALKVWLYVELREYVGRIREWGYDDYAFFGPFAPFITADSSVS